MFFKTRKSPGISFIDTDVHAHFLPGIDDGARDMDDSLALLDGLRRLGYRKMVATPHIMEDHYRNDAGIIRAKLEEVREAVAGQGWDIELDAAAEYMIDGQFSELLEAEALLPVFDNYVLVELGRFAPPFGLKELIFRMKIKGYTPILAHPERYPFFEKEEKQLQSLRDMGVAFQVNLLSLIGYYGSGARRRAEALLKREWVEFLGTDLHHDRQLRLLQELAGNSSVCKRIQKLPLLNTAIRQT